jgi:hypothetical protein
VAANGRVAILKNGRLFGSLLLASDLVHLVRWVNILRCGTALLVLHEDFKLALEH